MTIEELQEAKKELDNKLTKAVQVVLDEFYKSSGLLPYQIDVFADTLRVFDETKTDPIASDVNVIVRTEFRIA